MHYAFIDLYLIGDTIHIIFLQLVHRASGIMDEFCIVLIICIVTLILLLLLDRLITRHVEVFRGFGPRSTQ